MLLNNEVANARTSARTAATAAVLTATLGLAAASWVVAVRQMNGMDMGVEHARIPTSPDTVWLGTNARNSSPGLGARLAPDRPELDRGRYAAV